MIYDQPICIVTKGTVNPQKTFENLPASLKKDVYFFSNDFGLNDLGSVVYTGDMKLPQKRQQVLDWARMENHEYVIMTDDDTRFLRLLESGRCEEATELEFNQLFEEQHRLFMEDERWAQIGAHGYAFCNAAPELSYGLGNFYILRVPNVPEEVRYDRFPHYEDIDFQLQLVKHKRWLGKLTKLICYNKVSTVVDGKEERNDVVLRWKDEFQFLDVQFEKDSSLVSKSVDYNVKFNWRKGMMDFNHVTLEF